MAEWGAPLGDTRGSPQGRLLHGLGTGEAVERQVVLLLEELLGPWSEACEQGQQEGPSERRQGSPGHLTPWNMERQSARPAPATFLSQQLVTLADQRAKGGYVHGK